VAFAADNPPFRAAPAASYPHHQVQATVTIGVDPYNSGEKVKAAFGKLDLYQYGILPVLVVIQNGGKQSIKLNTLKAVYIGSGSNRVEATPAKEVRYLNGPDRPRTIQTPIPGVGISKGKKNPLDAWEVEGRAFAAQILEPGQTASGFFYFQTGIQTGSTIYISGLTEAGTGKELFYFEIPLR
jgi:hypothetical protein